MSIEWDAVSALPTSRRLLHLQLVALYTYVAYCQYWSHESHEHHIALSPCLSAHFFIIIIIHCYSFVF
jgi:hypothetical protein